MPSLPNQPKCLTLHNHCLDCHTRLDSAGLHAWFKVANESIGIQAGRVEVNCSRMTASERWGHRDGSVSGVEPK